MTSVSIWTLAALVTGTPLHATAQTGRSAAAPSRTAAPSARRGQLLPGTRVDAFGTIRGSAIDSDDTPLADRVVRLRDARLGRIVDTTVTDKAGLFTFRAVDPGSYIVELLGPDRSVVATSEILIVNAKDTVTAIVKLPARTPPHAGALGRTATSAILVTAAAAASGVLATQIAGEQKSPRQ